MIGQRSHDTVLLILWANQLPKMKLKIINQKIKLSYTETLTHLILANRRDPVMSELFNRENTTGWYCQSYCHNLGQILQKIEKSSKLFQENLQNNTIKTKFKEQNMKMKIILEVISRNVSRYLWKCKDIVRKPNGALYWLVDGKPWIQKLREAQED